MNDQVVFLVGLFVTLLLFLGVSFTILEFRKMAKNPTKYKRPTDEDDDE
ncbi:MAG: hypothetical protein IAF08_05085 [Rhizobacter sp.]|nr:hypothetical protein [Chlorobiales bacterium]